MKPEEQRIAIAEACGWHISPPSLAANGWALKDGKGCHISSWWLTDEEARRATPTLYSRLSELPDYLSDLNSMHEAEKILTGLQWRDYIANLIYVVDGGPPKVNMFFIYTATAAQRAEAFLRTIGKWRE